MQKSLVLICEEEAEVIDGLATAVRSLGYAVESVHEEEEALSLLQNSEVTISALFINMMPDRGSLGILQRLRLVDPKLPVIMVTGLWLTRDVVTAIRHGAADFLCKPIIQEELAAVLRNAVEPTGTACKPVTRDPRAPQTFTSADPRINEIERRVAQIGPSGVPVLIQGETGTGKEVLARSLHAQSTRANKPFLKLNCAALPSELVESELFGYERGAFTGAFERKVGIFELADGGTILLDEIGDMDIRLQAKLLQVLQDQEFRRIGGKETVRVNVRIMAATHRDLEKAIHDRTFREDLYYRLNVVVLHVPPLRERRGDIVSLGEFLIRKYADPDEPPPAISADLRNAILAYNWPGNVRELENFMRKLLIFRDPDAMARDLQSRVLSRPPLASQPVENRIINMERRDVAPSLEQLTKVNRKAEAEAILAALESTRWNRKHASTILEIDYKSLLYKMKKLGIDDNPTSLSSRPRPPLQRSAGGD